MAMDGAREDRLEDLRQLEHLAPIGFAFLLPYISLGTALLLCGGAVVHALFLSPRLVRVTTREQERRRGFSPGKLSYALCVAALLLLFQEHQWRAAAVWAMLAFGDSVSNVVGRRLGTRKLPFNPIKSWIGLAAFWVSAGLGAFALYSWNRPEDAGWSLSSALVVCLLAALPAAVAESLPGPVDDNILVCWVGALAMAWADGISGPSPAISGDWLAIIGLNAVMAGLALGLGWLSVRGGIAALAIGLVTGFAFGLKGFLVLCSFLVLGSVATRLGRRRKRGLGVEEAGGGRRGFRNVLAKGLIPTLAAAAGLWLPDEILPLAFCGALAAAAFDTVATEIGQWLGGRPVHPLTFKPVPVGTPGAVSAPGCLAGLAASGVLGLLPWAMGWLPGIASPIIALAGCIGGVGESLLAGRAGNFPFRHEVMNLLTTLLGATAGVLLWLLL